jgi:sulfur carrier protein ThiS
MQVTLAMHGTLRRFLPEGQRALRLDIPEGSTVRDLIARVGAEADVWLVTIGNEAVRQTRVLAEGEVIDCHPPIEGG